MPSLSTLQVGMTATPGRDGGLDRYFFDLARALPAAGVAVTGFVMGDGPALHGTAASITSVAADDDPLLARLRALRAAVRRGIARDDLFVPHFAPYALPLLDTTIRHPTVMHFHGPWAGENAAERGSRLGARVRSVLERLVYARGDRLIVLSDASAAALRTYGVREDRIEVVPGGVDLERFDLRDSRETARRSLGLPSGRRLVVTARRLMPQKGVGNLVAAIDAVRRRIPDVFLAIAGSGPMEPELRAELERRELGEHVRLLGHLSAERTAALYRAAELSVVPTIALEGFGLVVLESLACGTPCIVTPVGGLPDVVRDFDPSAILPDATPASLADGIRGRLCAATGPPSGEAERRHAATFAWPRIAERIAAVYARART